MGQQTKWKVSFALGCIASLLLIASIVFSSIDPTGPASTQASLSLPGNYLQSNTASFIPNQFIVKLADSTANAAPLSGSNQQSSTLDDLNQQFNILNVEQVFESSTFTSGAAGSAPPPNELDNILKFTTTQNQDLGDVISAYDQHPLVEYAEPVYLYNTLFTPTDPRYSEQWAHQVTEAEQGWDIELGDPSIVIAVIDTGVTYDHEDLSANMLGDCTSGCPLGTGYDFVDIDISQFISAGYQLNAGEDYTRADNDPKDYDGHGTHVAGIIAATANNQKGISGVCPRCKIMPLRAGFSITNKVGNEAGSLPTDAIAKSLRYAADNGADIISMSFGGPRSSVIENAIKYAHNQGVLLIAAAGNGNDFRKEFPAGHETVIAVAATAQDDSKASYSNFDHWVDVAAPGGKRGKDSMILSTVPISGGSNTDGSGYKSIDGTSMAAPYVAGVAGLILSKNPLLTSDQARSILRQQVDRPNEAVSYIGTGRVNVHKALQYDSTQSSVAKISSPTQGKTFAENVDIIGSATGTSYYLEYGSGFYPATWTQFGSGTQVTNGQLGSLDISGLLEESYTIRLVVNPGAQQIADTIFVKKINPFSINSPETREVFGKEIVVIEGTIAGNGFDNYALEWRLSEQAWQTSGVSLENNGRSAVVAGRLGTLDFTSAQTSGEYEIKLTVCYTGGNCLTEKKTIFVYPKIRPNWPFKYLQTLKISAPTVHDLNRDGSKEIVASFGYRERASVGMPPETDYVYAWDAQGNVLKGWPVQIQTFLGIHTMVPAVANLDNTGNSEIVISASAPNPDQTSIKGKLHAFNSAGVTLFEKIIGDEVSDPNKNYIDLISSPVLVDLDNDGTLEIIVTTSGYINAVEDKGRVMVFNHDGTEFFDGDNNPSTEGVLLGINDVEFRSPPAVADVNNDGFPEIIAVATGLTGGRVYVIDRNGQVLQGWPKTIERGVLSAIVVPPVAGDLDNDNNVEIVVATSGSNKIYMYNGDGSYKTGWPIQLANNGGGIANIALGNINGDNNLEIIVNHNGATISALSLAGTTLWQQGKDEAGMPTTTDTPLIFDFGHDGDQNILFASRRDGVKVLDNTGSQSDMIFKTFRTLSSPVITDLENDGKLELIIGSYESQIQGEDTLGAFRSNLHVINLDQGYNPTDIHWPMFQKDPQHTGRYGTSTPPQQPCGNNIKEASEACDGADSTACPGKCKSDCSCDCLTGDSNCDGNFTLAELRSLMHSWMGGQVQISTVFAALKSGSIQHDESMCSGQVINNLCYVGSEFIPSEGYEDENIKIFAEYNRNNGPGSEFDFELKIKNKQNQPVIIDYQYELSSETYNKVSSDFLTNDNAPKRGLHLNLAANQQKTLNARFKVTNKRILSPFLNMVVWANDEFIQLKFEDITCSGRSNPLFWGYFIGEDEQDQPAFFGEAPAVCCDNVAYPSADCCSNTDCKSGQCVDGRCKEESEKYPLHNNNVHQFALAKGNKKILYLSIDEQYSSNGQCTVESNPQNIQLFSTVESFYDNQARTVLKEDNNFINFDWTFIKIPPSDVGVTPSLSRDQVREAVMNQCKLDEDNFDGIVVELKGTQIGCSPGCAESEEKYLYLGNLFSQDPDPRIGNTFTHEINHLFGARDSYTLAGCHYQWNGGLQCSQTSERNTNPNLKLVRAEIGWADLNQNNIIDVVEDATTQPGCNTNEDCQIVCTACPQGEVCEQCPTFICEQHQCVEQSECQSDTDCSRPPCAGNLQCKQIECDSGECKIFDKTTDPSCQETDNGIDLANKGSVAGKDAQGNTVNHEDNCELGAGITEYFCSSYARQDTIVNRLSTTCAPGTMCEDGACILTTDTCSDGTPLNSCSQSKPLNCDSDQMLTLGCASCGCSSNGGICTVGGGCLQPQETCTDSDGGKDYSTQGAAADLTTGSFDICGTRDTNLLREWFCENGERKSEVVICPHGCSLGKCNSPLPSTICDSSNPCQKGESCNNVGQCTDIETTACYSDDDNGLNLGVKSSGVYEYCSGNILRENYCEINEDQINMLGHGAIRTIQATCDDCTNGVCQGPHVSIVRNPFSEERYTTRYDIPTSICSDSDNGKDTTVKGVTVGISQGAFVAKEDVCRWGESIEEYYCFDNERLVPILTSEITRCPSGQCLDGACI